MNLISLIPPTIHNKEVTERNGCIATASNVPEDDNVLTEAKRTKLLSNVVRAYFLEANRA